MTAAAGTAAASASWASERRRRAGDRTLVVLTGVATAVYLAEYASPSSYLARAIRVCIANLAGVPSIVFGLFGLGFFISTVGRAIDVAAFDGQPTYGKPSLIWAALTLAILTLPVV